MTVMASQLSVLRGTDELLRAATFVCVSVSGALILTIVGLATVDSISSFVFNRPIPAATNFAEEMLPAAVLLGAGQVVRNRAEIVVDILTAHMRGIFKTCCAVLAGALSLIFFGLLSYGAVRQAVVSVEIREIAVAAVAFPIWPMKVAFAVGTVIGLMEAIRITIFSVSGRAAPVGGVGAEVN